MENQANSKSLILNYGAILGAVGVFISLIIYAMGSHLSPHWSISVISGLILIGVIVFAIKKYKEANGGFLSWGQGVKIGVGVAIVSGLISVIYQYIFNTFIEPEFMSQMFELQAQKSLDAGLSEEQVEAQIEMGKKFSSPMISAAMGIVGSAILGFIISAIAGAIMKKTEEDQY